MKFIKKKKFIAFLILQLMVFSLLGCSNIEENQTESGEAYSEQILISDWMQAKVNRVSFYNDVVYFTTYEETESDVGEQYCNNRLFSVNRDGSDLKEIPIDLTKEDPLTMITSIMINEDNTISIWLSSYDSVEANQVNVFIKVDNTGKELAREDLNLLVDEQYVGKALVTPQGEIVAMAESSIYLFDDSLELVRRIELDGYAIGMAFVKENQVLCTVEDNNEKKKFQIIDIEYAKVVDTISLNKRESVCENTLFDSDGYDFCYRNDKGIYSYDIKNKKSICLLNYEKTNLMSESIVDVVSVGKDGFLVANYSYDGSGSSISLYTKPNTPIENNKTMITFGAFQFDENIKRATLEFNKTNTKYQITLKEYFDADSGEMTADKAIEELNKDIAKGTIPDILDLSMLTEQYASKGLFEDLIPYIEKDKELSEEIFIDSVFDAMKQEDKLYYITPDFAITTLIGSAEYGEEWDKVKLISICENQNDKMPFYAETKIDLLDILLLASLGEFYNWETGKCQFDSQEFKDILTFCDSAMTDESGLGSSMTRDEMIQQGKIIWIDESNFVPQEIMSYNKLFGEEIAYMGYPNKEGNGSYFSIDTQIGICSKSDVKDGAWEFIRMLLSYEYQEQYADLNKGMNRVPVRSDCFDLLMDRLSNPQGDIEGFDEEKDVISAEQEKEFRNLINNTHEVSSYNIEVMKIIEEEAQSYFLGKKDVNETVQSIQKRCTTYMNEKR